MTRDWDDWWPLALILVFGLVVAGGFTVAYRRPPREVANRFWQMEPQHHSECTLSDAKGNCMSRREWVTMEPHYYAVSRDGARCEVGQLGYASLTRGAPHKCWQLFGWSGGGESDSTVVARLRMNPEVRGASW